MIFVGVLSTTLDGISIALSASCGILIVWWWTLDSCVSQRTELGWGAMAYHIFRLRMGLHTRVAKFLYLRGASSAHTV